MYELGKKELVLGKLLSDLQPISGIYQRPTKLPTAYGGRKFVCGFDQGLGEKMIVFETLQEMQELYDSYHAGWALNIYWYTAIVSEIKSFTLGPDFGVAGEIINQTAADVPLEVKQAMAGYAHGNPGAAKLLAKYGRFFTTPKQVEELVGWPLSEHSFEKSGVLYNNLSQGEPVFPQATNGVVCSFCGVKSPSDIGTCPNCGSALAAK